MAAVLNAERLEVSVDGLTLSPDPEERPGAEGAPLLPPPLPPPSPPGSGRGPGAAGEQPEPGETAAGGAAEEARQLELRWGFGLEELYGLALRFFKGWQLQQQIMAALNSQTAVQFQQYAAQQYPGNYEQQQILIRQLQEQHYQQYMQQLYQVQLAQQQAALQKQQEVVVAGASLPASSKVNATAPSDMMSVNGQAKTHTDNSEKELEPETAEAALENGPKESLPVIAAPSMWTRPQIKDFKEKIRQDADSVITVGRGEVVTVRVPTHEEGSYLFWEFATDNYDIGFGVYFEWTDSPNTAVSVHVSESSDDDEEEEENISCEEKAKKNANKPLLDEIVPVYRRDCHEEVYAGSHQYPGRGVYLLKFDNSYSLWRSKSVYYRVYYTR
ncbi:PREDICTED: Golgi resident protein GCP60 [Propithecus coquereli]|uniref:Golgi resident protein GCP60 n=1 Tax=Propithecus coquereli TaxID=379532 RepID=UPI00063FBE3D|nr:PREDICTED: Golgi resident protein GCP60 [Propithecus coquereli]